MKTTQELTQTESNKLIAEFIGLVDSGFERKNKFNSETREEFTLDELKYHISWDWLMPVIKKIDSYANEKMTFAEYDDYRSTNWRMIDNPSKYDISNVHKQVVQFIQWYNETQK